LSSVEVVAYTDRPLLKRRDVDFVITYETPQLTREEAASLVSKKLGVPQDRIAMVKMAPLFGAKTMKGHCHVYEAAQDLRDVEPEHILDRMAGKKEKPKKVEKAKKTEKAEEKTKKKGEKTE